MKRSRFSEEQIIGDPARAGGGEPDGGCMPQAWDLERDVLQVEGEVRRHRRVGCASG